MKKSQTRSSREVTEKGGERATGGKVRRVTFQASYQNHGPCNQTSSSHLAFLCVLYMTSCDRIMEFERVGKSAQSRITATAAQTLLGS